MTKPCRSRWVLAVAGLAAAAFLTGCTPSADRTSGTPHPGPPNPAASVKTGHATPGGSTAAASPSASPTVRATPSAPPSPVRTTTAARRPAGDSAASCYDGSCTITVTHPVTVAVDPHRFGFSSFRVTSVGANGVGIAADTGGTHLQSSGSPGSHLTLNDLTVHVLSATPHAARLQVSPS
ncbi:hypothetical protein [Streptomyces sp. NPDC020917]|uniref:hypothetical protein n=1 Tax=Streptomyces sp. NPDC020917 TaxID=3365102 RepID=UPI0037BD264F